MRQRERLRGGNRGGLPVVGHRIVHIGANLPSRESAPETVTIGHLDGDQVGNIVGALRTVIGHGRTNQPGLVCSGD